MTKRWEFQPENVDPAANMSADAEVDSPRYWYAQPWYCGLIVAVVSFLVAGGLFGLGALFQIGALYAVGAIVAAMGFVPFFGGIANLLKNLIGARALKWLIVSAVIAIIVGCSAFLLSVALK